jgi:hypothetical protein
MQRAIPVKGVASSCASKREIRIARCPLVCREDGRRLAFREQVPWEERSLQLPRELPDGIGEPPVKLKHILWQRKRRPLCLSQ